MPVALVQIQGSCSVYQALALASHAALENVMQPLQPGM